jgi:hypothetical protein
MELALRLSSDAPHSLSWGWLYVSGPNLIVIGAMLALFVLALVLPFPGNRRKSGDRS